MVMIEKRFWYPVYTTRTQAATKDGTTLDLKKFSNGLKNDQRIKRIVPPRRDKTLCKNKAFKSVGRFSIRWAQKIQNFF
jgi:hypothetical protein